MIILSILIPSLSNRGAKLQKLLNEFIKQRVENNAMYHIEVITHTDNGEKTIGDKRNYLMNRATGKYLCFFDDDDWPSSKYIKNVLEGIKKDVDCCSLRGIITWDKKEPLIFEHSIKYKAYSTTSNAITYERFPNHLNVIKSSIAKQFKFPSINHGEDTDWATQIFKSGLIQSEHYIDEVIYHYDYITNK
jgi:glycosyltransferase involved in cell wall biosynthesis